MSASMSTRQQSSDTSAPLRVIALALVAAAPMAAVASITDPTETDPVRRTAVCLVVVALFTAGTMWLLPRVLQRRREAPVALVLALLALLLVVPAYWVGLPAAFAVPALWLGRRDPTAPLARAAMGIAGVATLSSLALVAFVR